MKFIALISYFFFAQIACAQSYELTAVSHCSSNGEGLTFIKKDGASFSGLRLRIFRNGDTWFGRETIEKGSGSKDNIFKLEVMKDDPNVIVFRYPSLYSGIATISIIKKAGRYYFTEISYSELLSSQNITIEEGSFAETQ